MGKKSKLENGAIKTSLSKDLLRDKWLYLLMLPGLIFMLVFRYLPMFGNIVAFMDFNQYNMAASEWVGFKHFIDLFTRPKFFEVMANTLNIAILKIVIGFPIPIILALMMNQMMSLPFKKTAQTVLYLPHFISWVVLAGLIQSLLEPEVGVITQIVNQIVGENVNILINEDMFVPMLIITDIYKGMGWGTIIYFAALSGIDPQLYEAAEIDGARKFKQLLHITLPSIMPTIILMLILSCNNILNAGFDQIFLLYSSHVYDVADIIDTYVYRIGIEDADYAFATAVGLFKSVIALILIVSVNFVAKKTDNEGLW